MQPFQPKLILFDLDGTLIEFHHEFLMTEAERILALLEHPPVEREVLEESFAEFDFFRFVQHNPMEDFVKGFWAHFNWELFPLAKPFAETHSTLEALRARNLPTAIVTARIYPDPAHLIDALKHTQIPSLISSYFTHVDLDIDWKDKRNTIKRACAHHGVAPAETMLVGDIPADIESAKGAGVGVTVAVASGGIREHILRKSQPDYLIPDISHFLSVCIDCAK